MRMCSKGNACQSDAGVRVGSEGTPGANTGGREEGRDQGNMCRALNGVLYRRELYFSLVIVIVESEDICHLRKVSISFFFFFLKHVLLPLSKICPRTSISCFLILP